jgi:hypothetical protein
MAGYADAEELHTTKSEKLLGFVMAAFLLIGGIWIYQKVDDEIREGMTISAGSAEDRAAVERAADARFVVFQTQRRVATSRQRVEFTREEWRAALDANRPAAALERRYRAAQAEYGEAQRALSRARAELAGLEPAAREAGMRIGEERREDLDRQQRYVFFARLVLVLLSLGVGYWLLAALRHRSSRWLPLGAAALGFATVFAFVLAADYLTDYFDPFDYGVALLAAVGVVATTLAFWALQRYLVRRLPRRRVRKGECPFCGYPVRGAGPRCEGCGREVVAACTTCGEPRRVGVAHCAACGGA